MVFIVAAIALFGLIGIRLLSVNSTISDGVKKSHSDSSSEDLDAVSFDSSFCLGSLEY